MMSGRVDRQTRAINEAFAARLEWTFFLASRRTMNSVYHDELSVYMISLFIGPANTVTRSGQLLSDDKRIRA